MITSAALIMTAVFLAFVMNDNPTVKMMGIGLAVGGARRRDHRARRARPGDDAPARRRELVAARGGSTGSCPTSTSRASTTSRSPSSSERAEPPRARPAGLTPVAPKSRVAAVVCRRGECDRGPGRIEAVPAVPRALHVAQGTGDPLRADPLRGLLGARPGRHRPRRRAGRDGRDPRPQRLGQVDAAEAASRASCSRPTGEIVDARAASPRCSSWARASIPT